MLIFNNRAEMNFSKLSRRSCQNYVSNYDPDTNNKILLLKKRALFALPEKCWESLYAVCEVLVI